MQAKILFSCCSAYPLSIAPGSVPSPICLSGSRPRAVFDGCKVSEKSPNYKIIQVGFPRFGHRKRISVTTRTYSPYVLQNSTTEAKTSLVMSAFFDIDLHSGRFCYTFAPARGARKRFPFLITNPLKGASSLLWVIIRPKQRCKTGQTTFQVWPFCKVGRAEWEKWWDG